MADFNKEIKECTGEKSIILGNGFGISYDIAVDEENFNWSTLLDLCEIKEGSTIHCLLSECHYDFELAHQKINNAIEVISLYEPQSELAQELKSQIQYLREQLVVAVSNSHPSAFTTNCTPEETVNRKRRIEKCRGFLSNFKNVFSLNYDLLLYWVRCFENSYLGGDSFDKLDDELVFVPDDDANFFFPHGALFLYRDGVGATKSRSSKGNPILARLENNIRNGIFPMCISEGAGTQKLEAIKSNYYLHYSYNRIKECTGSIFTFGCSFLDSKDDHIIKAMLQSPADRIIVGEFKPSKMNYHRLELAFEHCQAQLKTKKEIVIADTHGVEVW
ncbi:TPA: DUF4917 family protein [Pseudomonas aeruginosa]|uniref:DUF4917 family protein n=1 Tax=Pseudomonas aeruginosa TaxID=287 RepID=UPI000D3E2F9E|nr:DUF4917 family protein [Pseudomonas aeruginosa]MBV5775351.1 DUF4917 family protein [Pseudomonas aeruginosa]PUV64705.1 hypothetical protein DDK19_31020 [Pseudomonas aeruginosa]HBO9634778.1 DUF4917 family protein [Pseudomonas aeruginosa]HBO9882411.1 DUF4917 family protein [Pseudomonas aeruginosa]HBP0000802.1 DUF4917 family protein [Pseudomonas aeruginosa]